MVVAGIFTMITSLRRDWGGPFIIWAMRADVAAILVLTAMQGIGTLAEVVGSTALDGWLLLTLLLWFGPPVASVVVMRRRKQLLEHAA